MLRGVADRLCEALTVTIIDTTVFKVADHVAAKFVESVFFVDDELSVNLLGISLEAVATGFVLNIRMNVGIIPKKRRLDAFGTQAVNTINAAGGAAGVH